jgi:hypothetical protein
MADDRLDAQESGQNFDLTLRDLQARTDSLIGSSRSFAGAMTSAFTQAAAGGRQLDDVLKTLALRLSSMAVAQAFRPIAGGLTSGINSLVSSMFSGIGAGVTNPAAAAPELGRGSGNASSFVGPASVNVNVTTPDLASFRRSEAYLTGQIARAVARGQRSL